MGIPFGTAAWAGALAEEINTSSEYRNAAAQWGIGFNGDVLLEFEADANLTAPRRSWTGQSSCTWRTSNGSSPPWEIP